MYFIVCAKSLDHSTSDIHYMLEAAFSLRYPDRNSKNKPKFVQISHDMQSCVYVSYLTSQDRTEAFLAIFSPEASVSSDTSKCLTDLQEHFAFDPDTVALKTEEGIGISISTVKGKIRTESQFVFQGEN